MSSAVMESSGLTEELLRVEYRALMQFLHLAPFGLVRTGLDGQILLMNPRATMMLAPLGFGDGEPNLFDMLEPVAPDLRQKVERFTRPSGVICDTHRVMLPAPGRRPEEATAIGVTILRLSSDPETLMVVVTDQSAAHQLQQLKGG